MTNDSGFNLDEWISSYWAEMRMRFQAENNLDGLNNLAANEQGLRAGFNKALDLVMEEASKQFYKIGDAGVPVLTSRQLERIISKLRGLPCGKNLKEEK